MACELSLQVVVPFWPPLLLYLSPSPVWSLVRLHAIQYSFGSNCWWLMCRPLFLCTLRYPSLSRPFFSTTRPLECIPPKTLPVWHLLLCPTSWYPDFSPLSLTITMPYGVPLSSPMFLLTCLTGVSLLSPLSPLPLGFPPRYLLIVIVLELFLPMEDVSCRGLPAGLRFDPAAHWLGVLGVPWILGTTVEFYSTPLSLDCLTLMPQSPPLLSSPFFYCPPSGSTETFASTPYFLPG